ncbi:unnamed protein product [Caenorhabditis brenneri]
MARKTRFSMARKWEPCMVCRDHTIGVAQGKPVCNACNLFFRRSKPKEHEIPLCQNLCENNRFCSVIRRCRSCRMTKCLKLIWSNPSSEEESRVESSSPVLNQSKLFENMSMWNRERERTFLNYKVQKGIEISVEEVMRNGTGKNLIPIQSKTFLEWSFISQLTSIVFLMKLPFYEDLSEDDQKSFIKAYRFKSAMFFLAMHLLCVDTTASVLCVDTTASVLCVDTTASVLCVDTTATVLCVYTTASVLCVDTTASVLCVDTTASVLCVDTTA